MGKSAVWPRPGRVVKIVLTRGTGARGYAPPPSQAATRIVFSAPLPAYAQAGAPDAIVARWCTLRLARQPRLAGIKHLNRLENVLARAEWADPAILEGLLCDDLGAVIGGVMSNLLLVKDGELFTPDLSECGVAGVARTRLLQLRRVSVFRFMSAVCCPRLYAPPTK
ncbi:aminotransferase class IV [Thiobacillus sp.]|uniref:aminotransferase class IV n=1 Tax=Thiobacillus sp. TaxID=924 RepID=UPI0025CDABC8|nr:aminotransferase class IV [Thiobacillus sp.]